MANFFFGLNDVAEIKKLYRELVKVHHPDLGGETKTMQILNDQYLTALKGVNNTKTIDAEGKEHTYFYDQDMEEAVAQKLVELLGLKMNNVDIWLIGVWVWVKGDTKPFKDALKALGCRWHVKNTAWYFRTEQNKTWHSGKGLASIAAQYGAQKITDVKRREAILAIGR